MSIINKAIISAKREMKQPKFDSEVAYSGKKFKYASLSEILNCITFPLLSHDLYLSQKLDWDNGQAFLITEIRHSSGEHIGTKFPIDTKDKTMQQIGSQITYVKRYSISALLGLAADEDTDCNEMQDVKTTSELLIGIKEILELEEIYNESANPEATVKSLCKIYKIEKLDELPMKHFTAVKAALLNKKTKKNGE